MTRADENRNAKRRVARRRHSAYDQLSEYFRPVSSGLVVDAIAYLFEKRAGQVVRHHGRMPIPPEVFASAFVNELAWKLKDCPFDGIGKDHSSISVPLRGALVEGSAENRLTMLSYLSGRAHHYQRLLDEHSVIKAIRALKHPWLTPRFPGPSLPGTLAMLYWQRVSRSAAIDPADAENSEWRRFGQLYAKNGGRARTSD